MERWAFLLPLSAALVTVAVPEPARAADMLSVSLKAGGLADALRELSLISGTGILFSPDVVGNRRSPHVVGRMPLDSAIAQLLAGTGLDFRRTGAGTIVIFAVPEAEAGPAIPEILVVGQRTQNVDIRRGEMDIQPYQVVTARDIASSPADTVDQFLRTRLPSNATSLPPSQVPNADVASNRSEVDLHGLGAGQTLILVDGARMPAIPVQGRTLFHQPDLNGLPLMAIDRVESLTATAGGIYGPGATGGVVNVVLKRDYRGADLSLDQGLTARGDAPLRRVEGRIGFTPDRGRTDAMIIFSRSDAHGIAIGARNYLPAVRAIEAGRDPVGSTQNIPLNGIVIQSFYPGNLSLKPAFGGASLGSAFTFLPIGYAGVASDAGASLAANAGKLPLELSPDNNGTGRSLVSHTEVTSLLANVRHRISDDVEAFVDLIAYQNDSRADDFVNLPSVQLIAPDAPTNPFRQPLMVSIPYPGFESVAINRLRTFRLSAGLIWELPRRWRAEASYSLGRVHNAVTRRGSMLNYDFEAAIRGGVAGAGGEPVPNPFGAWESYVAALQAYKAPNILSFVLRNRFDDANVRLAGPLLATDAGPVSLSLLAEHRRENVPASDHLTSMVGKERLSTFPPWQQSVSSLYGEVRAPILTRDSGALPLRGLELQLALRFDDIGSRVPDRTSTGFTGSSSKARHAALAYTAGLRFFPAAHVMARASIATGALPPVPDLLVSQSTQFGPGGVTDPRRGGRIVGSEGRLELLYLGSPSLRPETARSLSVGLVLNPEGGNRPRLSVDYTHIDKRNEISTVHQLDVAYFIAHESDLPGRITRAPLTAADMAAGFTAGIITRVDTTPLNIGRTTLDAVDVKADSSFAMGSDLLRLYGGVTWQPRLRRSTSPEIAAVDYVGFGDGPLAWRGNIGVDWSHGRLTLGANGQYYHRYRAVDAERSAGRADLDLAGVRIPAQFYVDITAAYRVRLPAITALRALDLRFGIANLFDRAPPIVTENSAGYSYYADPRGRRFDATISAHF